MQQVKHKFFCTKLAHKERDIKSLAWLSSNIWVRGNCATSSSSPRTSTAVAAISGQVAPTDKPRQSRTTSTLSATEPSAGLTPWSPVDMGAKVSKCHSQFKPPVRRPAHHLLASSSGMPKDGWTRQPDFSHFLRPCTPPVAFCFRPLAAACITSL